MASRPRLLVGLGNPGSNYDLTRHNIGREFIDYLLERTGSRFDKSRQAEFFRLADFFGLPLDPPVYFSKPASFMNLSGSPTRELLSRIEADPKDLLVLTDDFAIPYGSLRLRLKGSAGGHNGLKSIIEVLGTQDFPRLRVGIGPAPENADPADWVLKRHSKQELSKRQDLFEKIEEGLKVYFEQGAEAAMNFLNRNHFE